MEENFQCPHGSLFTFQGLESSWKRHRENAELLWTGLEKLGLEMFIKDKVRKCKMYRIFWKKLLSSSQYIYQLMFHLYSSD